MPCPLLPLQIGKVCLFPVEVHLLTDHIHFRGIGCECNTIVPSQTFLGSVIEWGLWCVLLRFYPRLHTELDLLHLVLHSQVMWLPGSTPKGVLIAQKYFFYSLCYSITHHSGSFSRNRFGFLTSSSNLLICQPFTHSKASIFEKTRGNRCVPVKVCSSCIITNDMVHFAHMVDDKLVLVIDLPY